MPPVSVTRSFAGFGVPGDVSGLIVSAFAPPEKHELAVELARYGLRSLGIGLVLGVGLWAFRRFVD